MSLRLNYSIANSLLLARWRQSLVAAIGVTFSITMFIALLGFMNGLNDMLDGLVINRTPHIRLYNEIKPSEVQPVKLTSKYDSIYPFISGVRAASARESIYNSKAIMASVSKDPDVIGIAPRVSARVFFNAGNTDITGVVDGIDAAAETKLFHFGDYVKDGDAASIQTESNNIILGKELAAKLLVVPGDVVQATTPGGELFLLKVTALYQSGIRDYDAVQSFASIKTAQRLLGKPSDYLTDIGVKLYEMEKAPALAASYSQKFQTEAQDIQTANAQFETGSFIRSLISYAVGITLLIVAGFGIYNILNMMIYEKMDAIAIMKATGFAGKDVKQIFLLISLTIGLAGGLVGLVLGLLLSLVIDRVPFTTEALPTITTYPVNYDLVYYIIAITFSLITTWLAGWFPARKASKVDPVVIIRGK